MPTGNPVNVLTGVASLYLAPFTGSPLAAQADPNLDVTMMISTTGILTPASPWVYVGFSEDGVSLAVDRKISEIRVEEQSTPVKVNSDTMDLQIMVNLAEETLVNLKSAYGGGTITTVAGSAGVPGYSSLALSDSLDQLSAVFVATNSLGFTRSLYVPAVFSAGKVDTKFRRAATNRQYAVTLTAVSAPSAIKWYDVTATHA
jgi:hypothetical protein